MPRKRSATSMVSAITRTKLKDVLALKARTDAQRSATESLAGDGWQAICFAQTSMSAEAETDLRNADVSQRKIVPLAQ